MRISVTTTTAAAALLLPALASAQNAAPPTAAGLSERLSSLWAKVAPYVPELPDMAALQSKATLLPSTPKAKAKAAAAAVAPRVIANLTAKNWETTLGGSSAISSGGSSSSSDDDETTAAANAAAAVAAAAAASRPWLVLISGGNVTCFGQCKQLNAAWDSAASQARLDPRAPNLAYVGCEDNRLLCATWGATPGSAWWIEPEVKVAAPEIREEGAGAEGTAAPPPVETRRDVYVVKFNTTTVDADDITRLYKKDEYKTKGELLETESLLSRHPFDSKLTRLGLNTYLGYIYFAIGMVPSWTFMLMITMTMRMFSRGAMSQNKETPQQKAERERKEKYTADGKVRGAPPGDGRSTGML